MPGLVQISQIKAFLYDSSKDREKKPQTFSDASIFTILFTKRKVFQLKDPVN